MAQRLKTMMNMNRYFHWVFALQGKFIRHLHLENMIGKCKTLTAKECLSLQFLVSLTFFVNFFFLIKKKSSLLAPYPSVLDFWKIEFETFFKNQVGRTWFLVYFKLDFYCLCSLQKSSLKKKNQAWHFLSFFFWSSVFAPYTWFLKNWVWNFFQKSSYCVACKIQVWYRLKIKFVQLDFGKKFQTWFKKNQVQMDRVFIYQ